MFVIFSIAIAAAEAAIGLAIVIAIYRQYRTTQVEAVNRLKG
jgi:NADH-quinone oxidoreductase subunit K